MLNRSVQTSEGSRLCSLALFGGPGLLLLGVLVGIAGDPLVPSLLIIFGSTLFLGGALILSFRK